MQNRRVFGGCSAGNLPGNLSEKFVYQRQEKRSKFFSDVVEYQDDVPFDLVRRAYFVLKESDETEKMSSRFYHQLSRQNQVTPCQDIFSFNPRELVLFAGVGGSS